MIDWLCIKVTTEELDIRSVAKIIKARGFVVKAILVYETNNQVVRVAGVNNGLDWIDEIIEVDDGLDEVDKIIEIADKIDIYKVINFS